MLTPCTKMRCFSMAFERLQRFQREVCGVDGFFDELGVEPCRLHEEPLSSSKKESLMRLAVQVRMASCSVDVSW